MYPVLWVLGSLWGECKGRGSWQWGGERRTGSRNGEQEAPIILRRKVQQKGLYANVGSRVTATCRNVGRRGSTGLQVITWGLAAEQLGRASGREQGDNYSSDKKTTAGCSFGTEHTCSRSGRGGLRFTGALGLGQILACTQPTITEYFTVLYLLTEKEGCHPWY